jgi:hypothetical protein
MTGWPVVMFNEAISFQIMCDAPVEMDYCTGRDCPRAAIRKRNGAAGFKGNMASSGLELLDR